VDVATTRLARFRAYEVTPARFTRISLGALTWIYLAVTTGAVVRLTGPGLLVRQREAAALRGLVGIQDYAAIGGRSRPTSSLRWANAYPSS
jgi:hypothetical protein